MEDLVTIDPLGPPWFYQKSTYPQATESFRIRLTESIRQMMFVSGETAEPPVETTGIIEDIVRQQVIELVGSPIVFVSIRYSKPLLSSELARSLRQGEAPSR
jgi:transcription initiation protein SPT3